MTLTQVRFNGGPASNARNVVSSGTVQCMNEVGVALQINLSPENPCWSCMWAWCLTANNGRERTPGHPVLILLSVLSLFIHTVPWQTIVILLCLKTNLGKIVSLHPFKPASGTKSRPWD
jgi:hypothetical protein